MPETYWTITMDLTLKHRHKMKHTPYATVKHYRSLVPMAQEARKPMFHLTPADGAIGSHAAAANGARDDFKALAEKIIARIKLGK